MNMQEKTRPDFIKTPADALMAVAAMAISVDGCADDCEVQRLKAMAYMNPLYEDFASDELEEYIRSIAAKMPGLSYGETLNRCAETLPPHLKETAYAWAVEMAAANGTLALAEDRMLHDLRAIFGITPAFSQAVDTAIMALLRNDRQAD